MIPHTLSQQDFTRIAGGYDQNPAAAMSLKAEAYTDPAWFALEQKAIFAKSWQWVCHVEKVRNPGQYLTATIAGRSIVVLRDRDGVLRAFYNVCKHRAHELLEGEGSTNHIMCLMMIKFSISCVYMNDIRIFICRFIK